MRWPLLKEDPGQERLQARSDYPLHLKRQERVVMEGVRMG